MSESEVLIEPPGHVLGTGTWRKCAPFLGYEEFLQVPRLAMKHTVAVLSMLFCLGRVHAQEPETYVLPQAVSNRDTIVYTRVIRFDDRKHLFHVQDYFENGRIQMDAFYTTFDKRVKEEYQCNYRSNMKEGPYTEWHRSGRMRFKGHFTKGRLDGASTDWYESGQKEAEQSWVNGQLHGRVRYWSEKGDLQFESTFEHGMNQHRRNVSCRYLSYLPKGYAADTVRKWPLVIYLHGGSDRGANLKKLYSSGIPDQIYRGREFPFIMLAPQSPEHLRWSTDDWFENFFQEVTARYQIDTDRVYLTGPSLGGSGTWYIAARYPETFAAIAPISGFTSHLDYIDKNIDKLFNLPVWAFHGRLDTVVPFEETERIVRRLEGKNRNLRFSPEPDLGHAIHWQVYPGQEIYDWLLQYDRRSRK
jgi:pimeloyl-ACP methyl ester carboxylesterase